MSNNGTTVYLDDENEAGIADYQAEHELTKSKAINEIVTLGLKHHQNGWLDTLYRDLAMVCLTVGVVFAALFYRGDALGDSLLFYALLFISAAFLSLAADRYDFSVRTLVGSDSTADGSPRSG